ncbi:MAG TPA: TetR family transcriptional regulator [Solirubrobacteraceae bacterium]|nr:TetR family transcriptional regulator [Solirubrobacteraceae bacterium]
MGRWEPNPRGRLERAAMALFEERGFDQTTAAEIAARAGLTERTFFRHFADKREVLFGGAPQLQELFVAGVAGAPAGLRPIEAVASGLRASVAMLGDNRERASVRQAVVAANPELQERELIKLATLGAAVGEALRGRGVPEPAASLSAEAGIAAFKVGFARWVEPANTRGLGELIAESLDQLRLVTAGVG